MSSEYKRSIYIVNPKFQIKFSLLICLIIMISSAFYPLVINQLFSNIAERFPQTKVTIESIKSDLTYLLILWQIGFALLTFITCIVFTHRIAGPMFKLKKYLSQIRNGTAADNLYFRNGDYFKDIAEDVNLTVAVYQERFKEDSVYLSESISYLKNLKQTVPGDKAVVINEIVNKLSILEDRYDELIR